MPGFVAGYMSAVLRAIAESGWLAHAWMLSKRSGDVFLPEEDLPTALRMVAFMLEKPEAERSDIAKRVYELALEGCSLREAATKLMGSP